MTPAPPRSRGGRVLVGALVVDAVGNGLFLPLSLVYFVELTGVRLGVVGVLLSVATAITLPVPLWAGSLADRLGALRVVVGAQVLQAAGFLAYVWVEGPVTILLASTVVAVGVRFFWSAVFTALADYADGSVGGRSHDSWYALAAVARTAGLAVGGVVTGLVIADGRAAAYRSVAWIAVGCFAAAAVLIAVFVRVPRAVHHHGVVRSGWAVLGRDRPFLALTALNTVWALTSMMLATALPTVVLEAIDGPAWLTSVVLVANFVGITLVSTWVVRRLAPYRRTRTLMVAGALWATWSVTMATLGPGHLGWLVGVLAVGTVLFTAAEVVHAPISSALASAAAPLETRGRYLAAFQYSFAFASIIAPAFFATLFTAHRSAPWVALALLNVLSVEAMRRLERRLPAVAVQGVGTVDVRT